MTDHMTHLTRVALLGISVTAFGCAADGGTSMIILHNISPEVMDEGASCTFSPTSEEFVSAGMLDLETPQDYTFSPAIKGGLSIDQTVLDLAPIFSRKQLILFNLYNSFSHQVSLLMLCL